jgi:hypothetical protein
VNSSHLPDDLAQWPKEAHEILGVDRGVDPRDLRRAYTKLIRVFKPEHHPEHFRRIREAFEFLQRYSMFFRTIEPDESDPLPLEESPALERAAPVSEPSPESVADPVFKSTPIVTVDELWRRALRNNDGEAYRSLVAELDRGVPRPELFARLYWLLITCPTLDPDRTAADWLCRGMEVTGLSGVLLELYGMEFLNCPGEARSERATRLVNGNHPPRDLEAFARKRWQTLCRINSWDAILKDFDHVQSVVRRHDEVLWLGLLVDLDAWIAWGRKDPVAGDLARTVRADIRSLEPLALRNPAFFDRVDWFDAVKQSCRTIAELPLSLQEFVSVVRDGWLLPADLIRSRLEQVLTAISANPERWVESLEGTLPQGAAALMQFSNLLDQYEPYPGFQFEVPLKPEQIQQLADRFLRSEGTSDNMFRAQVLQFCLDNAIDPTVIRWAYHAGYTVESGIPVWVESLPADMSLHLVCRVCRLFRA